MDQFWTVVGSYWWVVFPLMGVLGAAGNAWERGARRRHQRRLEVMHAKAELKAAQAAARGKAVPAASLPAFTGQTAVPEQATTPRETQATQLERLFATHDSVTSRWLEYELDVAKIIAFPAMSDGRQPLTAAFLRAKRIADGLRPASSKARLTKEQLAEYRNAVADFEVAFDVAERDARRLRDSSFTEVERKRLDTAKKLLTVAIDEAATPAERQLAYRRVREELDGLISISDEAIEVLEKKVMLELGPTSAAGEKDAASAAPDDAPVAGSADSGASTQVRATAEPEPAAEPVPAPPRRPSTTPPAPATWPVPARGTGDAPGRVTHPKPHR
ncbi:hypothetical protein [Microbacterium timonense]|uniref:hypothetical protein n=1 Tax=Microbacterium timonense TaxID=2086576 RepID=UPI001F284D5C|nr:hypothetical protein [Microbacterium timonense]